MSVEDALEHPYLAQLHDPSDEPVCEDHFHFIWDDVPLNKEMLKGSYFIYFSRILSFFLLLFSQLTSLFSIQELIFKEMAAFHEEALLDETFKPQIDEAQ